MPNLKCYKYSCSNNHCSHCQRDNITVTSEAMCDDYVKRVGKIDQNCEFEFAYEQGMSPRQDECHICCEDYACVYNSSGDCSANYIKIDECGEKAKCCQVREE